MYLGRTLAVAGLLYFAVHFAVGYYHCAENFCPGDRESDWVYEYTDDDGKRFIVIDGSPMPKEQYQEKMGIGPYDRDKK